jgi:hypothetical protein
MALLLRRHDATGGAGPNGVTALDDLRASAADLGGLLDP